MNNDTRLTISTNVRAEIARKYLHQRDLAEALGISTQSLNKRLQGHRSFTAEELTLAAQFLKVPIGVLTSPAAATR